jgi:O-succinylbenzoic acid--CoA ligase
MPPIFANRVLLPPGRKAADAVSEAISKCINEKVVTALVPATKGENLGNKYETAIGVSIPCVIESGLLVCTSGSTGNPKAVEISSTALLSATKLVNAKFENPASWLLAINPAFIGGAMVIARAITQDQKWEYGLDENGKFSPEIFAGIAQTFIAQNGRVRTSLVAAQLSALIAQDHINLLKKFDAILVGGGQMSPEVYKNLKDAGVNLIRTYGMTETCGGVVWDGKALDDVNIRIENPANGGAGRISINSPSNATCYHGNSEGIKQLNEITFNNHWIMTQDIGTYENTTLKVIGRSDDIVISGGVNVSVHAIENVLRDQPGVEDAVVFAMPDETWGTIVAAVIVGNAELLALQDAVEKELGSPAKPRIIKFAHELPLLPNGKIDVDSLR